MLKNDRGLGAAAKRGMGAIEEEGAYQPYFLLGYASHVYLLASCGDLAFCLEFDKTWHLLSIMIFGEKTGTQMSIRMS